MKSLPTLLLFLLPLTGFAQEQFKGIEKQIKILHSNSGVIEMTTGQYLVTGKISFQFIQPDSSIASIDCDSIVFNEEKMILTVWGVSDIRIKNNLHLEPVFSPVTIYISKKYPNNSYMSWQGR